MIISGTVERERESDHQKSRANRRRLIRVMFFLIIFGPSSKPCYTKFRANLTRFSQQNSKSNGRKGILILPVQENIDIRWHMCDHVTEGVSNRWGHRNSQPSTHWTRPNKPPHQHIVQASRLDRKSLALPGLRSTLKQESQNHPSPRLTCAVAARPPVLSLDRARAGVAVGSPVAPASGPLSGGGRSLNSWSPSLGESWHPGWSQPTEETTRHGQPSRVHLGFGVWTKSHLTAAPRTSRPLSAPLPRGKLGAHATATAPGDSLPTAAATPPPQPAHEAPGGATRGVRRCSRTLAWDGWTVRRVSRF